MVCFSYLHGPNAFASVSATLFVCLYELLHVLRMLECVRSASQHVCVFASSTWLPSARSKPGQADQSKRDERVKRAPMPH